MLKRTALVLTLAAALLAAAPTAPLAPVAGSDHPAWGELFRSVGNPAASHVRGVGFGLVSTIVCGLTPVALGLGGVGGVVFGMACSLTGVA